MQKYSIVFIVGSPRSGSTLVDLVLGSNKRCTSLGEFRAVDRSMLPKAKLDRIKTGGLCATCGKYCEVWNKFKGDFYDGAYKLFKTPFMIDSSKQVDWPKKVLPMVDNYKIIRLTRSGMDRFGSYKQRRGKVEAFEIKHWVDTENQISKFCKKHSHYVLKYEEFAQKKGLKELCEYIGIEAHDDMWQFWLKKHHNIRGNTKTSMLVKMQHGLMENPHSKTLRSFYKERGMAVKYVSKKHFLSDKDIKLFKKLGGLNVDKELGYD